MADKKFSDFTEDTAPAITDVVVGLTGGDNKKMQIQNLTKKIQLDVAGGYAYTAGQISFDSVFGTALVDTAFTGVRNSVGLETWVPFFNNSASPIGDGIPVAGDQTYTSGLPNVTPADADEVLHVIGFLGVSTMTTAPFSVGLATIVGAVQGVDTSLLATAPVFLKSGGGMTNTIPLFPTNRFLIGGCTVSDALNGVIGVSPVRIPRPNASRSYSFASAGAGTDWKAGFYDWSTADANLDEGSTTVAWGTAGQGYGAHAGMVAGGAGVVDAGQVGLRVTGTRDYDDGTPQAAGQVGIITDDITTLSADDYLETTEKFSGQVTYELYVVSGTPTAYSLDFNYGYSKYEDFADQDVTVTSFEAVLTGGGNDDGFDIALKHHRSTGWTYAATGFTAGNGDICRRSVDRALAGDVANGSDDAYKRTELNFFVAGDDSEGVIVEITTASPGTIQTMDIHIAGVSEELVI